MAEIKVRENESLDDALRRFKRQCARSGVLYEYRKREHYENLCKKEKKSEAARRKNIGINMIKVRRCIYVPETKLMEDLKTYEKQRFH